MPTNNPNRNSNARFIQERSRLLSALGEMVEGGIVANIQHIGATSVSGLSASTDIDIALMVWPFPLESQPVAQLEILGYQPVPDDTGASEQRFRHPTGGFQLFFVEAGSERWMDYLILRDYLRQDESARQAYSTRKQAWAANPDARPGGIQTTREQFFQTMLGEARQSWINRVHFTPVEEVANELRGFSCPWYISGGWALDLFLGKVTRVHQDVDVVVAHSDQLSLQEHMLSRGWKWLTPFEKRLQPWPVRMQLELPRHQAHAHRQGAFIDFLLTDISAGVWHYRRDPAAMRTVERMSLRTEGGIPFLAPELILLFKSKSSSGPERIKDRNDFEQVQSLLDAERRAWLRWALLVSDPTNPWIERLV